MAKKKAERGAKTVRVKELIAEGKANKEIIDVMKAEGLAIHPTYVSMIRSKTTGGRRRKKRRKAETGLVHAAPTSSNGNLRSAISFCKSVGGIKEAEKLIATLREIKDL
jgi:hypothetical protein